MVSQNVRVVQVGEVMQVGVGSGRGIVDPGRGIVDHLKLDAEVVSAAWKGAPKY